MLFVSNKPIQVDVQQDRKVIVLLNNKIMFSHLDFIEEYLSIPLITSRPIKMHYQSSVMQTMVISQTTVEVYYCDWKTQIKLIKVILLNNEIVESVCYEKQTGWHIFGTMLQYEPVKITFHRPQEVKTNNILCQCSIGKNKYILSQGKLEKSHKAQHFKEVKWKDRMMVLRNCDFKVSMIGSVSLDGKKDLICINSIYLLIVNSYEVSFTIVEPTISYIDNGLLVSYVQKGKLTSIQKYQNNQFVEIGLIHRFQGELCGAYLYQQDLIMLQYQGKQIHLKFLPLILQNDADANTQQKVSKRKKLSQSISKIMEQSHEDGSQLFQKNIGDLKQKSVHVVQKDPDYSPTTKPIVRNIEINDEDEIKDTSLNEGNSEVLSRSGIDPQEKNNNQNQFEKGQQQVSFQMIDKQKHKSVKLRGKKSLNQTNSLHSDNQNKSLNLYKMRNNTQNHSNEQVDFTQKSQRSVKKSGRSVKGSGKMESAHNVSNLSNHSNHSVDQHGGQTPGFGFFGGFGAADEHWTNTYDKQNQNNNQISQQVGQDDLQESLCIQEAERSILKFVPQQLPLKVEKFKPTHGILTTEIYNKIQKSSYCNLISKAIEEDPDRLQELMQLFLPQVINEAGAPLFFQKTIKTYNPLFTQQKIRNLFKSIINRKQLKQKMTIALQLFKLSEVPAQILNFPQDFVKIMLLLYKQVYIEDLLKASQSTIEYLLQSYFGIKNFPQQIISIEDQEIDITHPRNMLNVMLYLNEVFGLKIEIIVKIYCSKLLYQDYLDILRKITIKQNIFEICQVSRTVLDQVVIERFNQLLIQSLDNAEYLWGVIQFLQDGIIDQYRIRLAVVCQFNKCNIVFDLLSFMKIKDANFDIFTFLDKIIANNTCKNLVNLKFQSIYRSLYWLQQNQKITYVTYQYIQLIKSLAQKFCQKKYFHQAFIYLQMVIIKIKVSFIAKLLYQFFNCKYLNRLANCHGKIQSLRILFPQIINNPEVDIDDLEKDKYKIPHFSNSFSCSWKKFINTLEKHLSLSMELKILIFSQLNIANQLFLMLDENMKRKFHNFLQQIQENVIVELNDINHDQSLNPKGLTSIRFQNSAKNELQSENATSILNRQDVLLMHDDHDTHKKNIVYKSMALVDHYNDVSQHKLVRRNSADKDRDNKFIISDEDLMRLRLLVGKNEIIEELNEIYYKKSQQTFIESLGLIDLEKIELYHIDLFKAILSRLFPFQIFLAREPAQAFQVAHSKIKTQLSIANFWIVYTIVQLMFQMGNEICKLFIQKCVVYFRNDEFETPMSAMIRTINPKLNEQFVNRMIELAQDYHLSKIKQLLSLQKI